MNTKGEKRSYLLMLGIVSELIVLEMGLIYVGHLVDSTYSTKPFGVLVGGILGLVIWMTHIINILKTIDNPDKNPKES